MTQVLSNAPLDEVVAVGRFSDGSDRRNVTVTKWWVTYVGDRGDTNTTFFMAAPTQAQLDALAPITTALAYALVGGTTPATIAAKLQAMKDVR